MTLGARTWPEVAARSPFLLAIPLGSTEQHGPHLPLDTDTRIAEAVATGLAARRSDVVVAPALAYGSSGEHAGFAGTMSLGRDALEGCLVELVRSLGPEVRGTVLVSGHGGNVVPMARAADTLVVEGRRVVARMLNLQGADAHAGRTETSLLLAIAPDTVRHEAAAPGNPTPVQELMPTLRAEGVRAVSANGVLGDPCGASAEEGRRLLAVLIDDLVSGVDDAYGPCP